MILKMKPLSEKLGMMFSNFEVCRSRMLQPDLTVGHFASLLLSDVGQQKDGESVGEPSFGTIWN